MKPISFVSLPLFFVFGFLLVTGCKGPETTVVRQNPITAAPDTAATTDTTASEPSAAFRQITMGEINSIPTLDPLFAENASTMRALQLVYEGLVRLNREGAVIAGIAKDWSVSNDSLRYTFTLRNNVYYHDSNAFNNGVGRKLKARDVIFVIERMAMNSVPNQAARLFMPIKGFEPFYQEQHKVFNSRKRVLNGVSGVEAPNDSTVVFTLEDQDPHFLQKLASPFAVIYPREAVSNNNPENFKAVGTGPFTLSQNRGDSLYTFAKFKNYYNPEQPVVNRIDVMVKKRESTLFKSFSTRNIDVLPELGLQTMQGVLDETGDLMSSYAENYRLGTPDGVTFYSLNFNPDAGLALAKAKAVAGLFDSTETFANLPQRFIQFQKHVSSNATNSEQKSVPATISKGDTVNIANTDDSYSLQFLVKLRNKLNEQGATLRVYNIYTPTRNTGLYTEHRLPFYTGDKMDITEEVLLGFKVHHRALSYKEVENLRFNSYPWWIDMRTVTKRTVQ